jgi:N,N-dimethylformamidase
MTQTELPITGYLDRFSHRPGESFTAFISVLDGGPYRARLVRVLSGDPNPNGPGVHFEDLSHCFDRLLAGRRQPIHLGSYGIVDAGPVRDATAACTWTVLVHPTLLNAGQVILAEEGKDVSVTLLIGENGATVRIASTGSVMEVAAGTAMRTASWYRVWFSADPATGRILVGQWQLDGGAPVVAEAHSPGLVLPSAGAMVFAAQNAAAPCHHFTGKLEDPAILSGFVTSWNDPHAALDTQGSKLVAGWDFSRGIDSQSIFDVGPQACHGRLLNLPTRAVVGARWTGREQCWRHAPHDYGAIHFHDDDLGDCDWRADFT